MTEQPSAEDPFFAAVSLVVDENARPILQLLWGQAVVEYYSFYLIAFAEQKSCRVIERRFEKMTLDIRASRFGECFQFEVDTDVETGEETYKMTILNVPQELLGSRSPDADAR